MYTCGALQISEKGRQVTTPLMPICSIQKSNQSCKKCAAPQEGHCEKDVKSNVAAKKWL